MRLRLTADLRYGDLALRYQDTILGHLYGHMNVDHFYFVDVIELEESSASLYAANNSSAGDDFLASSFVGPQPRNRLEGSGRYRTKGRGGNTALSETLRKDFGNMPSTRHLKLKDYAVLNVAPSIIPTYYPGVRIFQYNITGLDDESEERELLKKKKKKKGGRHHRHGEPKDDCDLPENEDKPHCAFKHLPRYYDKNSPSRRNGPLTPLGYTQFYLPDIDTRSKSPPKWKIEYSTFTMDKLVPNTTETKQPPPVPLHFLPGHQDEEGVDTAKAKKKLNKLTPFKMEDLTIGSYVTLAKRLAKQDKPWDTFRKFM